MKWGDLGCHESFITLIEQSIILNISDQPGATDKALEEFVTRCGANKAKLREKHMPPGDRLVRFPFNSTRKRMSTIIENATGNGGYDKRIFMKGGADVIVECCSKYLDEDGNELPLTDVVKGTINNTINKFAADALRTIVVGYKDIQEGENGPKHSDGEQLKDIELSGFTMICIYGIMDIIRAEVPDAVAACQRAGVTVRMVTGDNIITAQAIADRCRIIKKEDIGNPKVAMEGKEFFRITGGLMCKNCGLDLPIDCKCEQKDRIEVVKNEKAFKELIQTFCVMARARPEDKYLLVTGLKNLKYTVAVTGDGTNDAPALKKADVGFAMGITGTDVAQEAADILLTNDNFESIVKAVSWGRNIFDNIQRFLMFQLTINVVALTLVIVGSAITKDTPLQAIQLLWVNLIMDSLAALALATEMPTPELLLRPPQNRNDYIVSRKMVKHILGKAAWQCTLLFVCMFAGEYFIVEPNEALRYGRSDKYVYPGRMYTSGGEPLYSQYEKDGYSRHMTFIFTMFVLMQIFNMFPSRKIHDERNVFAGFFSNFLFIGILLFIIGMQFVITQFGSSVMKCHP